MKQWQDAFLKVDEIAVMEEAFKNRFRDYIEKDEDIEFEGFFTNNSLYLTCILRNLENTFYYPFETSLNKTENLDIEVQDAKNILLDFIEEYFEEYFTSQRSVYVHIDWLAYKFKDIKIYARAQVLNKELEELGNKILKDSGYKEEGE